MTMENCEIFAVFTLVTTASWVYLGRGWSFRTLALAMFFPGLFAPWFSPREDFLYQVLGIASHSSTMNNTVKFCIFGGGFAILIISAVLLLDHLLGWGEVDERYKSPDPDNLIAGFLRAAGEEIGWRCFLLPCLVQNYGVVNGLLISGVIWGTYHVPVMMLLTRRCKTPDPYKTVAAQFLSCILSAVPHGWLAMKTGYSFWASTIMHWAWNRLNPVATGSIYMNERGKVKGPQWLVNGEGMAGCLINLPIVILILLTLS